MEAVIEKVEVSLTPKKTKGAKKSKDEKAKEKKEKKAAEMKKAAEQKKAAAELKRLKKAGGKKSECKGKTKGDGGKKETVCGSVCSSPRKLTRHKVALQEAGTGQNSPVHRSWEVPQKPDVIQTSVSKSGEHPDGRPISARLCKMYSDLSSGSPKLLSLRRDPAESRSPTASPVHVGGKSRDADVQMVASKPHSRTAPPADVAAESSVIHPELTPNGIGAAPGKGLSVAEASSANGASRSTGVPSSCVQRAAPGSRAVGDQTAAIARPIDEITRQQKLERCYEEKSAKLYRTQKDSQMGNSCRSSCSRSCPAAKPHRASTSCLSCLSRKGESSVLCLSVDVVLHPVACYDFTLLLFMWLSVL